MAMRAKPLVTVSALAQEAIVMPERARELVQVQVQEVKPSVVQEQQEQVQKVSLVLTALRLALLERT